MVIDKRHNYCSSVCFVATLPQYRPVLYPLHHRPPLFLTQDPDLPFTLVKNLQTFYSLMQQPYEMLFFACLHISCHIFYSRICR